jgi:GT2 family glycosyltransferase
MNSLKSCAIILNYNGLEHLKVCVPSVIAAANRVDQGCEVVVVDNASNDKSVEWLREKKFKVQLIQSKRNECLFSLNAVVKNRPEDIVVILNNDMRFDSDFIRVMLRHFIDPNVFAVTSKVFNWDGRSVSVGRSLGYIKRFWFYKSWDSNTSGACLSLYAGGGNAAFRNDMFLELGGFDPLFWPGYSEDMDLSYRAWRRGWKVVYEPKSFIYHHVGATFRKQYRSEDSLTRLIYRNQILFTAKNIGSVVFVSIYLLLLPIRALRAFFSPQRIWFYSILDAVPRIPEALWKRFTSHRSYVRKEKDFLDEIKQSSQDNSRQC